MKRSEWVDVVKRYRANWPHATVPDASIAKWYDDLAELPVEQVIAAVEAIYREGHEFPPNGAQVLAKVAEVERSDPDHGEAWQLVVSALRRFAPYEWDAFYADLPAPVAEAARRYGFEAQAGYLSSEEGTVRAQFREIYKAVLRERRHDDAYASMGTLDPRKLRGDGKPKQIGDVLGRAVGA